MGQDILCYAGESRLGTLQSTAFAEYFAVHSHSLEYTGLQQEDDIPSCQGRHAGCFCVLQVVVKGF